MLASSLGSLPPYFSILQLHHVIYGPPRNAKSSPFLPVKLHSYS